MGQQVQSSIARPLAACVCSEFGIRGNLTILGHVGRWRSKDGCIQDRCRSAIRTTRFSPPKCRRTRQAIDVRIGAGQANPRRLLCCFQNYLAYCLRIIWRSVEAPQTSQTRPNEFNNKQNQTLTLKAERLSLLAKACLSFPSFIRSWRIRQIPLRHCAN